MFVETSEIVKKANQIHRRCGTRDPYKIARELGIEIMECPFESQRGAHKVIKRNRFIFLKQDLHPVMKQIARAMNSDINLVVLKVDTLISQGYRLRPQEHRNDFLKYNR